MAFDRKQFRDLISRVLDKLDLHSDAAVNLLLGTAAQESHFGTYLRQKGAGPALGVFQMEPATEADIHENYIRFRRKLWDALLKVTGVEWPDELALEGNLIYQIAMARIHYLRVTDKLPAAEDYQGMARYWKRHYNTPKGKGTEEEFVHNYARFVEGLDRI